MTKSPEAFRTISEVADELDLPQHVLRFWETKFAQIKPLKRAGGRRYYRPEDVDLLQGIRTLLYTDGLTIKGVQKVLREQGVRYVMETGRMLGQDDRPLPVTHSGEVARTQPSTDEFRDPAGAGADDSGPEGGAVHFLNAEEGQGQADSERSGESAISSHQRAALESILEELLELKFTLDGARNTLAKTVQNDGEEGSTFEPIRRLA